MIMNYTIRTLTILALLTASGCSSSDAGDPCGNGDLDLDELCDDGNIIDGDGCSADCQSDETCGNLIIDSPVGEECDDGNELSGDGCQANCRLPACGDGFVDVGELCDDGAANGTGEGTCVCTGYQTCGDGLIEGNEVCDDSVDNGTGEGLCVADCSAVQTCGDSLVQGTEACDDGNTDETDFCRDDCSCNAAVFVNSGDDPTCFCAQTTSTSTVTAAGWANVVTSISTSLSVSCSSCKEYTTTPMYLDVGVYEMMSQAVPCDCDPASLVLSGTWAASPYDCSPLPSP